MAKKKIIRKSNRPLTLNTSNHYGLGGDIVGAIGSKVGNIAGGAIGGGLESGAGSAISDIGGTIGGVVGKVNPVLGGIISAGSGIIGGFTNRMFGSKLNEEKIAEVEGSNKAINTVMVDNSSSDSVIDQWTKQDFGADFSQADIGKDGWFSSKAKNKYNELKKKQDTARNRALTAFESAADAADTQADLHTIANFAAYGGSLPIFGSALDYSLAQESLKNKQLDIMGKSNLISSKALPELGNTVFAEGGNLYTSIPNIGQHGGNFSNGVTIIGNGGSHEENPMEGVPMGIAPDGTPNLVEQGEVKFNDYIFSNRLFANKKLLESVNLPKSYDGHSFADIAERLNEESSERPNDPISKRGLMSSMTKLQQAQEQVRMKEQNKRRLKDRNMFATGGPAGVDPDLYEDEDEYWIESTGSKIDGNPFISDDIDYPATPTPPQSSKEDNKTSSRQGSKLAWLRYAPAVGAGLGVASDLLGLTNKPDYKNADLIGNIANNLTDVEYTPIGNYLTYKPLDRNYYLNKLNAEAGATRRALVNQSGGNRAAAMAGLLAADYNALGRMGDLARQAEEYNMAQRERVEAFNRGTNQFNAEMALKAATAKQRNDELRLKARTTQAQLRDQADARASAAKSANLTNLFDSLGEIGREEFSRNMIQTNPALYYSIDSSGRITYKNGYEDLSEAEKRMVRDAANRDKKKKAKGGYLTIRGGK